MSTISTNTRTRIKVLSREVKLTYLQSIQVRGGGRDLEQIAGAGGGIGTVSSGSSSPGSPGFLGIGASAGSSVTRTANDSGWIISRIWDETHFDKIRYAIGIRDIGVFFYTFANTSELVSTEWKSPKPIYKVQLKVVESIPTMFPPGRQYIEYYVSPDRGGSWYRMNPLDHPTIVGDDGIVVPKTITFNPDFGGQPGEGTKYVGTENPVSSIKFRAVLRAPSSGVDNPERFTPMLKSYRLYMYPIGGLRAST